MTISLLVLLLMLSGTTSRPCCYYTHEISVGTKLEMFHFAFISQVTLLNAPFLLPGHRQIAKTTVGFLSEYEYMHIIIVLIHWINSITSINSVKLDLCRHASCIWRFMRWHIHDPINSFIHYQHGMAWKTPFQSYHLHVHIPVIEH